MLFWMVTIISDDVAPTAIAMGTPGDKAKIETVVEDQSLDSPNEQIGDTPNLSFTTAQATEEMGFLSTPQHQQSVSLFQQPSTVSEITNKPEIFSSSILEQSHIEEYFSHTKFYPSIYEPSTSYSQTLSQSKIYSLEEPGPSGLQTPTKSKPCSTVSKVVGKKKVKPTSNLESPKKQHTCQICQKSYANIDKLSKHMQLHTTVSPFKCEHCKKSFSSKFKLVRHMLIHSDKKPFSCTVCERTFHRKDHLKNHIKVHSPTKRVYLCEKDNCKKEYTSLLSYKKHLALHAAQEGSLECLICSSIFQTKEDILFHLKIHAGSRTVKEKKYRCEHCDRKFFTKKDVKRHLVVHTGMRDFLCQFCPQRFGRKDHLGRHIKKSHSKNLTLEDLDTSSEATPNVENVKLENVKLETAVESELIIPEPELEEPSSEELVLRTAHSLSEETSAIMKFEETESAFVPGPLATDILGYCLDEVKGFFPESEMERFLDESVVESDLGLMLAAPTQNEYIHILEDINPSTSSATLPETSASDNGGLLTETEVLSNPEIQRLLQPSEEVNLPLPGFSQTFQSPPPPQPPPRPP